MKQNIQYETKFHNFFLLLDPRTDYVTSSEIFFYGFVRMLVGYWASSFKIGNFNSYSTLKQKLNYKF